MGVALALCSEASHGYGGSGQAFIVPGTEPRAMPGSYKQEYMQPVYVTSYIPVHHEKHASPVQYVTVPSTSGYHHSPVSSGHGYAAAPAVHAAASSGHGYAAAPAAHVSALSGHGNAATHVSHGHNVAPAINHGFSSVYSS